MLRVKGRYVEAEAAFRTATRVDPEYAQAWYNLGDLLDDQGSGRCGHRMLAQGAAGSA
jgi:tetratricopeptide (TPR) repeat protein